ncbi:zinc-ribbon domain containing protein [Endozoicomonas arenosclerae]|uniref:zinc-ribbon domain containing protein n=1 Tax=Endozoicomonas arenosclerae TaxID=1633495 RepID=UPI000780827C|nr:zinc-ribbon domain containing protein [Endozoicomonas arenosclerae]
MKKRKKQEKRSYVKHPRYGSEPIPSNNQIPVHAIICGHWSYDNVRFFPETAIVADTSKQNYAIYPRTIYVDIEERCRTCHRYFIFFAREQRFWFEELGFWVDAQCTQCIECRKKEQEIRWMQKRYQQLTEKTDRKKSESRELKQIAMELFQLGYIRDENKLRVGV